VETGGCYKDVISRNMIGNIDWIDLAEVRGKGRVLCWTPWWNGKRLSSQKGLCCMWLVGLVGKSVGLLVLAFVFSLACRLVNWLIAWLVGVVGWLVI